MQRCLRIGLLVAVFTVSIAVPAGAGVDSNPNALVFGPVTCDNGLIFEAVWSPTEQSVSGHGLDAGLVGTAKSLWLTDLDGNRIGPIWDRPGKGLDSITVWCWWPADTPTGGLGVDVIFNNNARG